MLGLFSALYNWLAGLSPVAQGAATLGAGEAAQAGSNILKAGAGTNLSLMNPVSQELAIASNLAKSPESLGFGQTAPSFLDKFNTGQGMSLSNFKDNMGWNPQTAGYLSKKADELGTFSQPPMQAPQLPPINNESPVYSDIYKRYSSRRYY